MKRSVLVIALILAVAACAACNSGTPSASDGASSGASSEVSVTLPEYTIASDTVHMLCWTGQDAVTSETGSFYKPNELMKQRYNCSMKIVRTTYEELPTKAAALVLSNDAPELIFFKDQDFPVFITQNIAAETLQYTDFSTPLFSDLKSTYERYYYKGKQYFMPINQLYTDSYIFYWSSFFEDAGIETPLEIYRNDPDAWTLSKLQEIMKDVTIDADHDGVVDVYGLAVHPGEMYMCSGADFVTINPQTGKYTNNLRDPAFNKFMNFMFDTNSAGDNTRLMAYNVISDFTAKKTAMMWAQVWPFSSFAEDINSGAMGFVVSPRVDGTDKWYVKGRIDGYWMGQGCENPGGAAAFVACCRFLSVDPATKAAADAKNKELYGFSDDVIALRQEFNGDAFEKIVFISYGVGQWGNIYQYNLWSDVGLYTGSWSESIEKYYPILQAEIDTMNASN